MGFPFDLFGGDFENEFPESTFSQNNMHAAQMKPKQIEKVEKIVCRAEKGNKFPSLKSC